MLTNRTRLMQFDDEMGQDALVWLEEAKHEGQPKFTENSKLTLGHRKFYLYRRSKQVLDLQWLLEGRNILDVGAGIGSMYFALRNVRPKKLIALEPNIDNFNFLQNTKVIHYDDYVNATLEDFLQSSYDDFDVVFLSRLPVVDWRETLIAIMSKSNVVDIVISSEMFLCEFTRSLHFLENDDASDPVFLDENISYERFGSWTGQTQKTFWSLGELDSVAQKMGFALVSRKYGTQNKNAPIGVAHFYYSRLR